MRKRKGVQFNCFSPPVMVATLIIESFLAVYSVWRYKMTVLTRLITLTLVSLATFQLAEYFVCTGYGLHAEQWSRLGFVAITTLPALAIHQLHILAGKPRRRMVAAAYSGMIGYIGVFMLYPMAFVGHQCTGNYVIFQFSHRLGGIYAGTYYYAWLLIGVILGILWSNEFIKKGKPARKKLETVRAMILGYLIFLVPTALANTVKPETRAGIPSIMCGFAVMFALILALYILPRVAQVKRELNLRLPETLKP